MNTINDIEIPDALRPLIESTDWKAALEKEPISPRVLARIKIIEAAQPVLLQEAATNPEVQKFVMKVIDTRNIKILQDIIHRRLDNTFTF